MTLEGSDQTPHQLGLFCWTIFFRPLTFRKGRSFLSLFGRDDDDNDVGDDDVGGDDVVVVVDVDDDDDDDDDDD